MPPAFASWLLLALVSALPPVVSAVFAGLGEHEAAAAALRAPAILAPGLFLLDLQLLADPWNATRPELLVPTSVTQLGAGAGLYLLLLSRLLTTAAGVLSGGVGEIEARDAARARPFLLFAAVAAVAPVAGAVLMPRFVSDSPFLLVRAAADEPLLALLGTVYLGCGLVFAAGYVASSTDPGAVRGGLAGVVAAAAGPLLVPPVSALLTPGLAVATWQWLVLYGAVAGLVVLVVVAWLGGSRREITPLEIGLAGGRKLERAAGVLAVVAGALTVLASALPVVRLDSGDLVTTGSSRLLTPTGFILLGLGLLMLFRDTSGTVRPALAVTSVLVPVTALPVLDTASSPASESGPSGTAVIALVVVCLLLTPLAGLLCLLAGGREREESVDLSELVTDRALLVPAVLGAVLALGAYALPVLSYPDFPATAILNGFRTETWGLLLAAAAVVAAALLAARSRPRRAAALFAGAALVVLVRVLELPVRADGSAGTGFYLGLAALVVLLGGAGVALSRRPSPAE